MLIRRWHCLAWESRCFRAERAISNEDDVDEKPVRRVFFQKGLRATLVQTSITRTIVLLLLFESPHFSHRSKVHSVNVTTEFRSFLLFSTKCSFPLWNSVIFPVQFGESHGRASSASFHTVFLTRFMLYVITGNPSF